jgi:hypothetical protein
MRTTQRPLGIDLETGRTVHRDDTPGTATPDEVTALSTCDGSGTCPAELHIHGCHRDRE